MDCSAPGFSVHGISQARILECVPTWPLCPSTLCPAQRTLVLQRAAKSQSPGDSWWLRQATCPDPPLSFPPSCTKAGICDQPLDKETIHKSAGRDVGRASAFPSERCWCTRSRPSSPVLTTAKFKKPHYDHKATGVKRKAKRIEKKKKKSRSLMALVNHQTSGLVEEKEITFLLNHWSQGCWYENPKINS